MARYAKIVGYWECSFFGVNRPGAPQSCRSIWVKRERDLIDHYLAEGQEELENEIGYPLGTWRWFQDAMAYRQPIRARRGWVLEGGVRAVAVVAAGVAVDHTADPATIGPVPTAVTDPDELRLYYPAALVEEELEIHPSDVDLAGGFVTFRVPRCRMVHPDVADNPRTGLDYADLANFLATVDVRRVYNDPGTQAVLHWPNRSSASCLPGCCCPTCSTYSATACITVRDAERGSLSLLPATYSAGAWTATCPASCCVGRPEFVTLNYRAGRALTRQAEDAIVRLAHAKMPAEPCGCEVVKLLWERDRNVPEVVTRERLNCRFGTSDGAWAAWQFAQALRLHRGGRPL
jgi:hypothetical protein